jgi:hypothetical protein
LKQVKRSCLLLAAIFFDPEDEGDIFLRNAALILADFTKLFPRDSSKPSL